MDDHVHQRSKFRRPGDAPASDIDKLPQHLMEMIMERLPLECCFRFRIVCRRWNDILCCKDFIRVWIESAAKQPWLMICMPYTKMPCLLYSFVTQTWRTVNPLSPVGERYCRVNYKGSAAGLLLVDIPACGTAGILRRCVCNPITGTWRSLPGMLSITGVMARGIAPAGEDGESYKIVVVGKCRRNSIVTEVYDSVTESWKIAGNMPADVSSPVIRYEDMVFCSGCLFSLTLHHGIMVYDMGEESWATMPMPSADINNVWWPRLAVCGSSLLIAGAVEEGHVLKDVVIWEHHEKNADDRCWTEIGRMPPSACEDFRVRSSRSTRFECVGVGNYVCFRAHGSIKVLVYDLALRLWAWLPRCPHTHGDCKDIPLRSLALTPRPDRKL